MPFFQHVIMAICNKIIVFNKLKLCIIKNITVKCQYIEKLNPSIFRDKLCGRVDVAHDSFIPIMIDNFSLTIICEL